MEKSIGEPSLITKNLWMNKLEIVRTVNNLNLLKFLLIAVPFSPRDSRLGRDGVTRPRKFWVRNDGGTRRQQIELGPCDMKHQLGQY